MKIMSANRTSLDFALLKKAQENINVESITCIFFTSYNWVDMKCIRVLYTVEIQIIKYINDMGRIVYCIILHAVFLKHFY